jgi:hypothetical protein
MKANSSKMASIKPICISARFAEIHHNGQQLTPASGRSLNWLGFMQWGYLDLGGWREDKEETCEEYDIYAIFH